MHKKTSKGDLPVMTGTQRFIVTQSHNGIILYALMSQVRQLLLLSKWEANPFPG
jgi:hypothetical protein